MKSKPAANLSLFAPKAAPLVISCGVGVDSVAMLVGLAARGIRPDLILFADTGNEKPETYAYIPILQGWLAKVGFPELTLIKRAPVIDGKKGSYDTLETNCTVNETLPSLAFGGRKGCSLKWKVEPMDAFVEAWEPAKLAWAAGLRVRRAIGYDAGPKDSKRCWDITEDERSTYVYFLREWGWDRERCKAEIEAAGLPVPPKSACSFCPATQPEELVELHRKHPDLTARIIAMEAAAKPNLVKIQGLWGNGTKGSRGARPRPGSMTEFIRAIDAGQIGDDGLPINVGELPWDHRAVHLNRVARRLEKGNAKAGRKLAMETHAAELAALPSNPAKEAPCG